MKKVSLDCAEGEARLLDLSFRLDNGEPITKACVCQASAGAIGEEEHRG